jgi:DNA modification methylase
MAQAIPFSQITISANRQRKEFDPEALTDLGNSISKNGLLHPIVVRETPNGFVLVAGERRLRAMETLWLLGDGVRYNGLQFAPYEVPASTLGELTPLEAEEAELDENLKRRDLTWQERAEAIKRLHELRVQQAIDAGESHTISDTHEELREEGITTTNFQTTRAAILIADHLDNPAVASAKNERDALKAIKREEDRERNTKLAEQVGATYNSSVHTLLQGDCLVQLKSIPDNSFDVILCDPPYGIGADDFGDGAGKLDNAKHRYEDSPQNWNRLMDAFVPESFRVAKAEAHAYIFCDIDMFPILRHKMRAAGWDVFRTPLIDYKLGSGRVPRPEHGPRRQYEIILYALKGNRNVTGIFSDVIPCRLEENIGHGANKPVELYVDLLRRSVRPGDTVLDAFAGTGTIFPAAHQCKVYATGIEMSPEYYGICVQRLNALDEEPAMI